MYKVRISIHFLRDSWVYKGLTKCNTQRWMFYIPFHVPQGTKKSNIKVNTLYPLFSPFISTLQTCHWEILITWRKISKANNMRLKYRDRETDTGMKENILEWHPGNKNNHKLEQWGGIFIIKDQDKWHVAPPQVGVCLNHQTLHFLRK